MGGRKDSVGPDFHEFCKPSKDRFHKREHIVAAFTIPACTDFLLSSSDHCFLDGGEDFRNRIDYSRSQRAFMSRINFNERSC